MRRPDGKEARPAGKIGQFSWLEYIATICIMGLFAALPAILFGGMDSISLIQGIGHYIIWYLLYWAAVALLFCAVTAWQKYRAFDKPMRMLGEAAKRVAGGDFSVYLKPLDPLKRQTYMDLMFRDFNKMVEELGSLETMKSDFIANVSHEFKTPLAVIQNYAMDLKEKDLDPQTRREYLDAILSSAENLASLVTNILRLNKLENQAIQLNRKPYDLCRQLAECAISFEEKWEDKGIEFQADLEDACVICGDADMLSLVWNNLLANAIKFTGPGGAVTLRQCARDGTVTVSVGDTGCGMSEETAKHIFDKFYQGDSSHAMEGNGLGLTLAKRVVELSGGSVSVSSSPGKGSVFTVSLPIRPEKAG